MIRSAAGYENRPGARCATRAPQAAACLVVPVLLALTVTLAHAGMPQACGETGQPARLAAVESAQVLRLDDGRAVRLADIGPGTASDREPVTGASGEAWADETVLRTGRALMLYAASKTPDRWGRMVAHVRALPGDHPVGEPVVGESSTGAGAAADHADVWVSGLMVEQGLAVVMPGDGPVACIDALYGREIRARAARRGLWRNPENRVLRANDPALAEAAGGWRIVAGRVISVGETKSTHYLNFGRDWSTDFTVTVRASDVQRFAAAGRHPIGLKGHLVRVRGWLREWNGAAMDVRRPGEIEVVDGRE